jgi:hypothetical protein
MFEQRRQRGRQRERLGGRTSRSRLSVVRGQPWSGRRLWRRGPRGRGSGWRRARSLPSAGMSRIRFDGYFSAAWDCPGPRPERDGIVRVYCGSSCFGGAGECWAFGPCSRRVACLAEQARAGSGHVWSAMTLRVRGVWASGHRTEDLEGELFVGHTSIRTLGEGIGVQPGDVFPLCGGVVVIFGILRSAGLFG